MNKAQLTDAVAAATDTSKAEAGRAVEATLNAIAGSLAGEIVFHWLVSELST